MDPKPKPNKKGIKGFSILVHLINFTNNALQPTKQTINCRMLKKAKHGSFTLRGVKLYTKPTKSVDEIIFNYEENYPL